MTSDVFSLPGGGELTVLPPRTTHDVELEQQVEQHARATLSQISGRMLAALPGSWKTDLKLNIDVGLTRREATASAIIEPGLVDLAMRLPSSILDLPGPAFLAGAHLVAQYDGWNADGRPYRARALRLRRAPGYEGAPASHTEWMITFDWATVRPTSASRSIRWESK